LLKYWLPYEFGATFPRLVLGGALVLFGLVVLVGAVSAISYAVHPFHYEKRGNGWAEVPGRIESPIDRIIAKRNAERRK